MKRNVMVGPPRLEIETAFCDLHRKTHGGRE